MACGFRRVNVVAPLFGVRPRRALRALFVVRIRAVKANKRPAAHEIAHEHDGDAVLEPTTVKSTVCAAERAAPRKAKSNTLMILASDVAGMANRSTLMIGGGWTIV
jgi:hypothetical protein